MIFASDDSRDASGNAEIALLDIEPARLMTKANRDASGSSEALVSRFESAEKVADIDRDIWPIRSLEGPRRSIAGAIASRRFCNLMTNQKRYSDGSAGWYDRYHRKKSNTNDIVIIVAAQGCRSEQIKSKEW